MVRFRLWNVVIISTVLIIPLTAPSPSHDWRYPVPQTQPGCPPAQQWSEGRELTFTEKTAAFSEVLANGQSYGGYNFALNTSTTPPGVLLPVLAKGVAGVESDWTQYINTGVTKINADCDSGMMQVNTIFFANLLNLSPSLRSDTKGNIAAGSQVLSEDWDMGSVGSNPVVNDQDPEQLLNWYYAISTYNGGPTPGSWANNPNCGPLLSCGSGIDFSTSRFANWQNLNAGLFPYQERVLYNLQYPKLPNGDLWDVKDLGLKEKTLPGDYGIRPDDALFLAPGPTTRQRNLLLFRHRLKSPVRVGVSTQPIEFEYALPIAATVTIDILDAPVNGTVVATPLLNAARTAGWHNDRKVLSTAIESNYVYRIRATRGDPAVPATYFEGQYVQKLNPIVSGPLSQQQYLPVMFAASSDSSNSVNSVNSANAPVNLLWNGDFNMVLANNLPRYWNVQAIYGENVVALQKTRVITTPSRLLTIDAAPNGRVEVSQRVHLPAAGTYTMTYDLRVNGIPAGSTTRFDLRQRAADGTVWVGQKFFNFLDNATYYQYTAMIDAPTGQLDQVISFIAHFDANDSTSRFELGRVGLYVPVP